MSATPETARIVADNWKRVCEAVVEACAQAGRSASEVTVVGVSKYVGPELTQQLIQAGCGVLGENRPQQIWDKDQWLREHASGSSFEWHMIGHLQRNKARRTIPLLGSLHSLDSLRLAKAVNDAAANSEQSEPRLDVLLEVNVSAEEAKTGAGREEILEIASALVDLPHLRLRGLMAMSALNADAEQARRQFSQVREYRDQLAGQFPDLDWSQLSMGMSGDFEQAILEGSTFVRIGSSLWTGVV